jgi:hypothetical protein
MQIPLQNADFALKADSATVNKDGDELQQKLKKAFKRKMNDDNACGHPVMPKNIQEYLGLLALQGKKSGPELSAMANEKGGEEDNASPQAPLPEKASGKPAVLKDLLQLPVDVEKLHQAEQADEPVKQFTHASSERAHVPQFSLPGKITGPDTSLNMPLRHPDGLMQMAQLQQPSGSEDTRINYIFRHGDGQHSVQVQMSNAGSQASVNLNPSDSLVSQRLQNALVQDTPASHVVIHGDGTDRDGRQSPQETTDEEDDS